MAKTKYFGGGPDPPTEAHYEYNLSLQRDGDQQAEAEVFPRRVRRGVSAKLDPAPKETGDVAADAKRLAATVDRNYHEVIRPARALAVSQFRSRTPRMSRPTRTGRSRTRTRGCTTRRTTKAGTSPDGSDPPGEPSSSPSRAPRIGAGS